jgi:GNAT superfamily N-acetyltransferase
MKVEHLDAATATDSEVAAWHACVVASYAALWPDEPAPPLAYLTQRVRNPGTLRPYHVYVAWDDARERALGAVETWWWDGANGHRIFADLYVDPSVRRQGVGRALVDGLSDVARAAGRTALMGGARYDGGGVDFTKTLGAKFGLDEYRSRLFLPEATVVPFSVPGFSVVRWTERCPDRWIESYARLSEVMNTAPQGAEVRWNDEKFDADRIRGHEKDMRTKQLGEYVVCVADDDADELVALTQVQVADTWPEVGDQHNTGVIPAYRGRKLAKLVKTDMALWLRRELPELRLISTWNAVENVSMLAVNAAMGYGQRERWTEAEIIID